MNSLTFACLLATVAIASCHPDSKYTDRYDNIDLDEILGNKRLLEPYIKCLLDKGRCAPDAKELKVHLTEALENDCAKCTAKQRDGTRKVIKHIINHEPDYWQELIVKFDPQRKYVNKYEKDLKEVQG